ncbi:NAD(P)H-hydrate epimerase [Chloroflexi bacterium TSY]|nr:NAD(P)H-hydrate epimerase [Chloroflexi bacterium TSY]
MIDKPNRIPTVTLSQSRQIDKLLTDQYGISTLQLMEMSGYHLALVANHLLENEIEDRSIVILIGKGFTGGAGLVTARHLLNRRGWLQIIGAGREEQKLTETQNPMSMYAATAQQLMSLQAMDVSLSWAEEGWELPPADLVIDVILDCDTVDTTCGNTQIPERRLIQLANSSMAPILSLDLPSGIDADTGQSDDEHIRATATLSIGPPKAGLLTEAGQRACGDLYVADVGVPWQLYEGMGIEVESLLRQQSPILVRQQL